MHRLTLLVGVLLLVGCASAPEESLPPLEPVRNTTDENVTGEPQVSGMCVEGAPDCEDMVVYPLPP